MSNDNSAQLVNIISLMVLKDYLSMIVQHRLLYTKSWDLSRIMVKTMESYRYYCGETIPSTNSASIVELLKNDSKLRDFFFVVPMLWHPKAWLWSTAP
jgi:hypothetical protein